MVTTVMGPSAIRLAEHSHFESVESFLESSDDLLPKLRDLVTYEKKRTIAETDEGETIRAQLSILDRLLSAYRSGELMESS